MIRILHPIMPFTERASGIPAGFEGIGNGPFIEIHPLPACRGAVHPAPHMIAPGQKLRPRRRTHRAHKETIEPRPISRQRINMRRHQIRIAIEAEITPPLIIGQNDDHIRLLRLNPGMSKHQKNKSKSLHVPNIAQQKGTGKEFLLMIPECPFMPRLILKPDRPNWQCLNMPIGKNGTSTSQVAIYHPQRLGFPIGTGRHFKHSGILEWANRFFFNPFIGVSLIGIRHQAGIPKHHRRLRLFDPAEIPQFA